MADTAVASQNRPKRRRPPAHVWKVVLAILFIVIAPILAVLAAVQALEPFAAISGFFTSIVAILFVISLWDLMVSLFGGRYLVYGRARAPGAWWILVLPWCLLVGFLFGHYAWH